MTRRRKVKAMKKIVILGAKGRFGRATTKAFLDAGWHVTAVARKWENHNDSGKLKHVEADGMELASVEAACRGHKFILNALNPIYPKWERELPIQTRNILSVAKTNRATILIPGNVYNYGTTIPALVTEETPHVPDTKKGRLRIEMETAYRDAQKDGVRTIILRGGDFIEGKATGNWFEDHITNKVHKGIITYPGPTEIDHTWAYLPDMARAMVGLTEKADQLSSFEEFCFSGFTLSGQDIADHIERVSGQTITIKRFPWMLARIAGLFSPMIREVMEMRYLWQRPHRLDGSKLASVLPEFQETTPREAFDLIFASEQSNRLNAPETNWLPVQVGDTLDSSAQRF